MADLVDLFIVRHAKAETLGLGDDAQRPVSEAGRSAFTQLVRGLTRLPDRVDVVAASPYLRAQQTAQILCDLRGWSGVQTWPELLPESDPRNVLRRLKAGAGAAVIVAHQPLVGRLVTQSGAEPIDFEPGTIVALALDSRGARLKWTASP